MIYKISMKNIIRIFILLSLIVFSLNSFAKTPTQNTKKKFLRAKKHFKVVEKETQKLEKALSEPELEKVIEPIEELVEEPMKAEETLQLQAPEETKVVEETKTTENAIDEQNPLGWLYSLQMDANINMIKVDDRYGRQLKLISVVGFGGYIELGYRFGDYFGLVGDYGIDRVKFSDFDAYTISQENNYLMSGRVGPRFYLGKKLSLDILAGLRQHYTVYAISTSSIGVDRFNHGSISVGFNYSIVDSERFIMDGRTVIDFFLPVTKSAWNTSLGLGAKTELNMGVPVGENNFIYFNLGGGYMNLKQSISSQYTIFGFGGLGFCRRT